MVDYRQRRKNCAPPEAGTDICQVLLLLSDGTFVSVIQFGLVRFVLVWTENPALARGQFSTTLPEDRLALKLAVVLSV